METTKYIFTFIAIITVSVAVLLTGMREITKDKAAQNEDVFNKRAILSAIDGYLPGDKKVSDFSNEEVLGLFENQMEQLVLDANGQVVEGERASNINMAKERKKPMDDRKYPLYIYTQEDGSKFYIATVRGNGLWDEIWGYIALENDLNTIAGAAFDHTGETPGLGAEIKDNPNFPRQFKGKKIFDEDGEYVSILVRKGGAIPGNPHQVDGISGATVTADGVTEMMHRGLRSYVPYMKSIKQENAPQGMLEQ